MRPTVWIDCLPFIIRSIRDKSATLSNDLPRVTRKLERRLYGWRNQCAYQSAGALQASGPFRKLWHFCVYLVEHIQYQRGSFPNIGHSPDIPILR